MEVEFQNGQEYFGMSGPWLADCFLANKRLRGKFLLDNVAFSPDKSQIALSRYTKSLTISRTFKIVVTDLNAGTFFISKDSYNALFIESIKLDTIVFHEAFHDKDHNLRETIRFSTDTFLLINREELFYQIVL